MAILIGIRLSRSEVEFGLFFLIAIPDCNAPAGGVRGWQLVVCVGAVSRPRYIDRDTGRRLETPPTAGCGCGFRRSGLQAAIKKSRKNSTWSAPETPPTKTECRSVPMCPVRSRPGDRAYENRMLVRADAPGPFAAWRPLLRHTRIRGSGKGMTRSRAIGAMQRPCRAPGRGGCAALIHPTDSRLHLVFRCGSGRGLFLEHHDVAPAAAADLEGEFAPTPDRELAAKVAEVAHVFAVDGDDQVAFAQAGFPGRRVAAHFLDHRAADAALGIAVGHAHEHNALQPIVQALPGDARVQVLRQRCAGFARLAVSQVFDDHLATDRKQALYVAQLLTALHHAAVEPDDDVAGLEPGLVGGAVGLDRGHHRTVELGHVERAAQFAVEVLYFHAEVAATDFAEFHQLLHDVGGGGNGDGEADTDVAARRREDGGVDAHQLASEIDQRAAGIGF